MWPELVLLMVLEARTLMTRAELNAVEPVILKVPPFRLSTLLAEPKLAVKETANVPFVMVVSPV